MNRARAFPIAAPALATLVFGACAPLSDAVGLLQEDSVIFVAQTVPPDAVMDALFHGEVRVDGAGCVRLEGSNSTVVWPHGFTLSGGKRVRDAGGRVIGLLGGDFRFGGGHVPSLHEGIAVDAGLRARVAANCPGSFWVVGEIVRR